MKYAKALRPVKYRAFRRQVIAQGRGRGDPDAAAKALARVERTHWHGRSEEAANALIERAAKDCSVCAVCAEPLALGQSVTLRRFDIGPHHHWPVWGPVCLSCTLSELRAWPWSSDHPGYDGFRRYRCRTCGRPMRVASRIELSPACCTDCQRRDRLDRSKVRRRVVHKPKTCIICDQEFIPKRADARTCSNKCRQAWHRQRNG
jgi:hypothetical protein